MDNGKLETDITFLQPEALEQTRKQILKNAKDYEDYQRKLKELSNQAKSYIQRDLNTRDPININNRYTDPWDENNKAGNKKPILSRQMNDVIEDKYSKNIITSVNIDSRLRDYTLYPNASYYSIYLNTQFSNV